MNIPGFVWDATRCVYWPSHTSQAQHALHAPARNALAEFRNRVYRPHAQFRRAFRILGRKLRLPPPPNPLSFRILDSEVDSGVERLRVLVRDVDFFCEFDLEDTDRARWVHIGGREDQDETGVFFAWWQHRGHLLRDHSIIPKLSTPLNLSVTSRLVPIVCTFQDGPDPFYVYASGCNLHVRSLSRGNFCPWLELYRGKKQALCVSPPFVLSFSKSFGLRVELLLPRDDPGRCNLPQKVAADSTLRQETKWMQIEQIFPLFRSENQILPTPRTTFHVLPISVARDFLIEQRSGELSHWRFILHKASPNSRDIVWKRCLSYKIPPATTKPGTHIDSSTITLSPCGRMFTREQSAASTCYQLLNPLPIAFTSKPQPESS